MKNIKNKMKNINNNLNNILFKNQNMNQRLIMKNEQ